MKIKQIFLWAAAILVYFCLYGYRLSFPNEMYFDEVYEVKTAQLVLELRGYESIHPPLGHFFRALSILIMGDTPWAWRFPSLVAGFGVLVVLYLLTKSLNQSSRTAFFAVFLFGFDGLSFTQARIGTLNAIMLFFMLLSIFSFTQYAALRRWDRRKAFLLSGLCLGLAIATRWVSLLTWLALVPFYLKILKEDKDRFALFRETLFYLVLLPTLVYLSVFAILPALSYFHGKFFSWKWIFQFQTHQIHYNLTLKEGHAYGSEWWQWPILARPIWYVLVKKIDRLSEQIVFVKSILCMGNPLIFWSMFAGLGYVFWQWLTKRTWLALFIVAGFLGQWLPWAFVQRIKFFHYFYAAMPFVAIALAMALERLWKKGHWGKAIVTSYLVLAALMFAYWYPLLNGMPVSNHFYLQHIWFKSWT